jgi:hypothetical protein
MEFFVQVFNVLIQLFAILQELSALLSILGIPALF